MALAARDRGPGFKFVSSPKSSYMSSPIKTADSKLNYVAGGPDTFLGKKATGYKYYYTLPEF